MCYMGKFTWYGMFQYQVPVYNKVRKGRDLNDECFSVFLQYFPEVSIFSVRKLSSKNMTQTDPKQRVTLLEQTRINIV